METLLFVAGLVAGLILVMRIIDFIWLIEPNATQEHFHISWLHLVAPIGIGGLWLTAFMRELAKQPLMPVNDPEFPVVLEQVHEHH